MALMTRMKRSFIHSQGDGFDDTQLRDDSNKERKTETHGGQQHRNDGGMGRVATQEQVEGAGRAAACASSNVGTAVVQG